ncbi:hypothetical protein Q5752_006878 [Cryptotrichosporon argae]
MRSKEAKYADPLALDGHLYSRETAPNSTRAEVILTSLIGCRALCYGSGLPAIFAVYTYLKPKRVAITGGYHGVHTVLDIHTRLTGPQKLPLDCSAAELVPGDVVHVETPDPFALRADVVVQSGTEYLGGHSDLLAGVVAVRRDAWWKGLWEDRMAMGNVMGSLEGWLTVRSLRMLELRVARQSSNAEAIVDWLGGYPSDLFSEVHHASIQVKKPGNEWLRAQMLNGFRPVFAVPFRTLECARRFPSLLDLFHHATSLGGGESLVEWRAMSDETVDRRVVRFSIGVEDAADLH